MVLSQNFAEKNILITKLSAHRRRQHKSEWVKRPALALSLTEKQTP